MKRSIVGLVLAAAACAPATPDAGAPDSLASAAATITQADLHDRIAFLASDELRGRDTPSPGLETAAAWIADQFAAFGLEPAGDDGWLQRYPYPGEALDPAATTLQASAGTAHAFEYGRDYFAISGTRVPDGVGAVYVDTESGMESQVAALRDQAVVVRLDASPQPGRSGFRFGRDARRIIGSTIDAARQAGAVAVLFVLEPTVSTSEIESLAAAEEMPRRALGGVAESDRTLPAFFLARPAAERLLAMGDVDAAAALDSDAEPAPLPLAGVTLRLAAPASVVDDATPPNVVGLLRGSDPELRDTYVVLSAHFDHLGVGRPDATGDSIYNGADDDASGTSVMVEVAQALAALGQRPRRSIVFLAVSGEEKGLLGSEWYSDHPTVPLDAMIANINIDMVGRNAPDSIVVIGQEYSSMGATLDNVAARHADLGLTVAEDIWPEQRFFFRSDHFNFARKEIPALFFFAGIHEDYHRPSDEVGGIDLDKVTRVGRMVFYLTHEIADSRREPVWDPEGLETVRALTSQ